ncbi:MAG: DUF1176 domain-containing protein [Reyranella sp.]|nr:DUF1176 domain-containing protein [Reyranella sp.]
MRIATMAAAAAAMMLTAAWPVAAADDDKIDLKLFGKQEVGPPQGCSVLLWQANRDPEKDRYAYVFHERLAADHARRPATLKIGDKMVEFRRVAIGGRDKGYKLFEQQLYKSTTGDYTAILDLKLADEAGEAVEIEGGTLTVVTPGKLPFRLTVKGGAGCMTPAAAAPPPPPKAVAPQPAQPSPTVPKTVAPTPAPPPPAAAAGMFAPYQVRPSLIPRAMLAEAQKKYDCNPEVMKEGGVLKAFQLSEESAVWELACDRFAYQASSVFALVHAERPAEYTFIGFAAPPGRKRDQPFVMLNAEWNPRARTVSSFALGRGMGDCGTYEVHRLVDGRFRLVEFREKTECDGKTTPPEQYKLVFRAN